MSLRRLDARHRSTAWDEARRMMRTRAEIHLRQAGRLLELLPEDPEAHRAARRSFREASRLRSERLEQAS